MCIRDSPGTRGLRHESRARRIQRGRGERPTPAEPRPPRRFRTVRAGHAWRRSGRTPVHCRRGRIARTRLARARRRRRAGGMTGRAGQAMDHRSASRALEQIASLLEFKGENAFRVRAFRAAARALATMPQDLPTALADGTVAATRGIGPATLQIIQELADTGQSSLLDALRKEVPPGLVEMSRISGLGIQRIRQVHQLLNIDSLPELEAAARDGRLARLPRFGARTAENILRSIRFLRQAHGLRLRHHAEQEAETLAGALRGVPGITGVWVAGELRRAMEVIREVVLVVVSEVPSPELFR